MLEITDQKIHLHRNYVDFRKQINGLTMIAVNSMKYDIFSGSLFVFCCKRKDKLKIVYWNKTGFCMWQIRPEEDKFKWPIKHEHKIISWNKEQFIWLLKGINVSKLNLHKPLNYDCI